MKSKLRWIIISVIIVSISLIIIFPKINIDIGNIIIGIALLGFVYVIYQFLEYKKEPKTTINISLKAKLISPLIKINRYKFHIIIEHEIKERGEMSKVKVEDLEIKFRKSDHPDIYKWCYEYATDKIKEHVNSAEIQYPDAKVTYSPVPSISTSEKVDK